MIHPKKQFLSLQMNLLSSLNTADEFIKFSQYQKSLKSSSTHVPFIVESGKPNTCLISSSSKWVIDYGVTNHMTGNFILFSTLQSHNPPLMLF